MKKILKIKLFKSHCLESVFRNILSDFETIKGGF